MSKPLNHDRRKSKSPTSEKVSANELESHIDRGTPRLRSPNNKTKSKSKSKSPTSENELAKLHANDEYINYLNELECLFHDVRPPVRPPKKKSKSKLPSPNKKKGGKRSTLKKSMKKK